MLAGHGKGLLAVDVLAPFQELRRDVEVRLEDREVHDELHIVGHQLIHRSVGPCAVFPRQLRGLGRFEIEDTTQLHHARL